MDLSVVIVNYNVKHYLEQCLHAVFASNGVAEMEVFVVDNCSSDGSIDYLRARYPQVHYIENSENMGFARANNIAVAQASGRYVLLLNPDTIVTSHTFADCIALLDNRTDVGGLGTCMLRTDGSFALESRRGLPTPFVAFCKMSGLTRLFPYSRVFGRYYMRYLDEHEVNDIEVISGAFMMLRREAIDKVGMLDETFFMYGEDIDLSYRLLKAGYSNVYIPSPILHYKGESTEKSSFRYVYTFYKAMQLFFNKHYRHYSLLISLPISAAIWTRSAFAYLGNKVRHGKRDNKPTMAFSCVVVGTAEMLDHMKDVLQRHYPDGQHVFVEGNEQTLPDGHLTCPDSWRACNMVVYDTDAYSYDSILRNLAATPGHTLRLGTYSFRTGMFVNETSVFS